jgi:hypothetical protein
MAAAYKLRGKTNAHGDVQNTRTEYKRPLARKETPTGMISPQRMNASNNITPQSQLETPIVKEDADKSIKFPESNIVPINLKRVYQTTLKLYPTQK